MKRWSGHRVAMLVLVALLLAVQPAALLAQAQDGAPTFVVAGVAGATLRAEPNGASTALAVVPAGASVTLAGPDVVSNGTAWRQVRTAEGLVGFLPVGFLIQTSGEPVVAAPIVAATATPAQTTAAVAPGQTIAATSNSQQAPSSAVDGGRSGAGTRGPDPTPIPTAQPLPPTTRTTVERRRGQDVAITRHQTERAPDGREMGAGRIVVKFQPGAAASVRTDSHRAAGAATTESTGLPDTLVANVPVGTVAQALAAYRARPDVAWAEPDYVRRKTITQPNDPNLVSDQWNVFKVGAPLAWDLMQGDTAPKVAILDCGVFTESSNVIGPDGQRGHPDLRGKVALEQNFAGTVDVDDWCDHGTMMAGIAGAKTNNSIGIAGVGFNVKLLNGKVLDDDGSGFDSWVANGIVWATDNGAGVISMSLGGDGGCNSTLQTAINYAWTRGVIIVAAAGNGGDDGVGDPLPEAPGSCANVVAVGAIDKNDQRASFSNYNANTSAGAVVPVAAPGVGIFSTGSYSPFYYSVDGTSPATPHVAAVAALVKGRYPGESNAQIVNRLIASADPITGTGSFWTNGRIDAAAALAGVTCSPRPKVTIASTPKGSYLEVTVTTSGLGNGVRYIQVGGSAGVMSNATLIFPGSLAGTSNVTPQSWNGTTAYVPSAPSSTVTFNISRQSAGTPTTVQVKVQDMCGTWTTLVGGGSGAGF
ncbi:MAG: S8 family serine peptidase [Chloroflexi bacterium]|nr:S8 family serine peptidase [Chloroflexota bacterium]